MEPEERTTRRGVIVGTGVILGALAGCSTDGGGAGGTGTTVATDTPTSNPVDETTATQTAAQTGPLAAPVAGDPDAPVTVAVYEDFACPHCKTYNQDVYPKLRSEYVEPGTVRYEHRDFPIPVDPEVSWQAASAARAVQATVGTEAFFDYADLLFENQDSLGPDTYASLASEVGADVATIREAAVEERFRETVEANREDGSEAGVRGTPTAVVDGELLRAEYETISDAIERASSDST